MMESSGMGANSDKSNQPEQPKKMVFSSQIQGIVYGMCGQEFRDM